MCEWCPIKGTGMFVGKRPTTELETCVANKKAFQVNYKKSVCCLVTKSWKECGCVGGGGSAETNIGNGKDMERQTSSNVKAKSICWMRESDNAEPSRPTSDVLTQ